MASSEDAENLPGLEYVLSLAREELQEQLARQQALTSRSVQLLGFSGVVLAIVANSAALAGRWHWCCTAGTVVLLLSCGCLLVSLLTRRYKQVGMAGVLEEEFLTKSEAFAKRVVLRATVKATQHNATVLSRLNRWVRAGAIGLMAGVVLITLGAALGTWG